MTQQEGEMITRKPKTRRDGDGSIYAVPGGFRVAVSINDKKETARASTMKEAKAALRALLAMKDAHLDIGSGKQTVAVWLDHWMHHILQVKPRTLEGYTFICAHYITPYIEQHHVAKLSAQHIERWQTGLAAQGLSVGTILNARRRLGAALEAARIRKIVPENVMRLTAAPKAEPSDATVFDEAQTKVLLDSLEAEDHRLFALFFLACTLGMRQAELTGLRRASVNLDAKTLTVREQLPFLKDANGKRGPAPDRTVKNGKPHVLPLSAAHVAILRAHRTRQRQERLILGDQWHGVDQVFTNEDGGPLDPNGLYHTFKRAIKRAGLPDATFHSLRKSAASIMLAHGVQLTDVSRILNHSSVSVTARWYAKSFSSAQQQAVETVTDILRRKA